MSLSQRCCPVCSQKEVTLHHTITYPSSPERILPTEYRICSCNCCGAIFDDVDADEKTFDSYYNAASKYTQNFTAGAGGYSPLETQRFEEIYQYLAPFIPDHDIKIADIGCGKGGLLDIFYQHGYHHLSAFDASEGCIDFIRKNRQYSASCANINAISESEKFDLIICAQVFEHLFTPNQAVEKLTTLLNDSGLLYIEVPDLTQYDQYIKKPYHYFDVEHINHFSLHSLTNLLHLHHYKICNAVHSHNELQKNFKYPIARILSTPAPDQLAQIAYSSDDLKSLNEYLSSSSKLQEQRDKALATLPHNQAIFLWGMGAYAIAMLEANTFQGFNLIGGIDINPELQNKTFHNLTTYSPDILKQHPDASVFITATVYVDAIKQQLQEMGFKGQIYSF